SQTLLIAGTIAVYYTFEFIPIGFGIFPLTCLLVFSNFRVRNGQSKVPYFRNVHIEECLSHRIFSCHINLPSHKRFGVNGYLIRRTEEVHNRRPPSCESFLHHFSLLWCTRSKKYNVIVTVFQVE